MGLETILGMVLPNVIPSLIHMAERNFPKRADEERRGDEKKAWVHKVFGVMLDRLSKTGRVGAWIASERETVVELVDVLIDELVSHNNAAQAGRPALAGALKPQDAPE